jgi:DNA-binding CsgD family transcriptional regulator/tetratricopeptide (TPR) repeat protein
MGTTEERSMVMAAKGFRTDGIVGREVELTSVASFVEGLAGRGSALLFDGEAGIGKSTLWAVGVESARTRGVTVLSAQPAESEAEVAYAVLGDLLRFVPESTYDQLPKPQRSALRIVALLDDPGSVSVDARTVGVATGSLLQVLARDAPTLVSIDDCQWVDDESAAALSFAFRRVGESPVSVLLSRRTGGGAATSDASSVDADELPFQLGQVGAPPTNHVTLRGLSESKVIEVLSSRVDQSVSKQSLQHLAVAAQGNPFVAVQLAEASSRLDQQDPLKPLQLPESVGDLLVERVNSLDASLRELLIAVAVIGQPSISLAAAVVNLDREAARERIDEGVRLELLSVDAGRVRCAHPLLGSAALRCATPTMQRRIHRRVAEIADDVEEQARHLLFATDPPDVALAGLLDAAADRAAARGAPLVGATFSDRARAYSENAKVRSTNDHALDIGRLMKSGRLYVEAGEPGPGRARFEEALEQLGAGAQRAEAMIELGRLLQRHGGLTRSAEVLRRALDEAGDDATLAATASLWLGFVLNSLERTDEAGVLLERSLALAEEAGDRVLLVRALTYSVVLRFFLGQGVDDDRLKRAEALVQIEDRINVEMRPEVWRVRLHWYCGRTGDAAASIRNLHRRFLDQGLLEDLVKMAILASPIARDLGDGPRVHAIAEEARSLSESLPDDNEFVRAHAESAKAMWYAYDGRPVEAMASLDVALTAYGRSDYGLALAVIAPAVAFVCLTADDVGKLFEVLHPLCRRIRDSGLQDPGTLTYLADVIESAIAVGKYDEANDWIAWLDAAATRFDRPLEHLRVDRCRALLAAQETRFDDAIVFAERAASSPVLVDLPWERARTLLVLGQIRRRAKQRTAGGEALRTARSLFGEIGMSGWVTRTSVELERLGMFQGTDRDLTPTELQVAELAAAGKSNPDIAATLFMSRKTVESNLSRAYSKLSISTRSELRGALEGRDAK